MNQCCVQLRKHNSLSAERGLYSIYVIPAHLFTPPDGNICIQTAEMHRNMSVISTLLEVLSHKLNQVYPHRKIDFLILHFRCFIL